MTVDGQAPPQDMSWLASIQMPPQGEGVGMVLEDVVVFARLVRCYGAARLNDIFARYEELRRKRINAAYDEANLRWETNKDFGWLA